MPCATSAYPVQHQMNARDRCTTINGNFLARGHYIHLRNMRESGIPKGVTLWRFWIQCLEMSCGWDEVGV